MQNADPEGYIFSSDIVQMIEGAEKTSTVHQTSKKISEQYRREVDAALADATSAMQAHFTDEAFERQVALVNEQRALDVRLANLVQANEDARALGTEDN